MSAMSVEQSVEQLQKDVAVLKRQMEYLKHLIPNYGDIVSWVTHKSDTNVADKEIK